MKFTGTRYHQTIPENFSFSFFKPPMRRLFIHKHENSIASLSFDRNQTTELVLEATLRSGRCAMSNKTWKIRKEFKLKNYKTEKQTDCISLHAALSMNSRRCVPSLIAGANQTQRKMNKFCIICCTENPTCGFATKPRILFRLIGMSVVNLNVGASLILVQGAMLCVGTVRFSIYRLIKRITRCSNYYYYYFQCFFHSLYSSNRYSYVRHTWVA